MNWRVHAEPGADGTVHVWPDGDAIVHDPRGWDCICGPRVERYENGNSLVTHASLDGRELSEVT